MGFLVALLCLSGIGVLWLGREAGMMGALRAASEGRRAPSSSLVGSWLCPRLSTRRFSSLTFLGGGLVGRLMA